MKCFLQSELYYLGHLNSGKGIHPLPEKLQNIRDLLVPNRPKEVRPMLGLTGYYHKVVM